MASNPRDTRGVDHATVSCAEISNRMHHAGTDHRFVRPDLAPTDCAIEGRFLLRRLKSGIVLHATEIRDLHEMTTQIVTGPDLTFFVVLDGHVDFSIGDRGYYVADRRNTRANADCGALMLTDHAMMTRRAHKGDRTRKITVSVGADWLEDMEEAACGTELKRFTTSHLAHAAWRASPRVIGLAEQILNPPDLRPLLKEMYIESRSIELVAECLATLSGHEIAAPPLGALSMREARQARAARDYIEANLQKPLSLTEIARAVGLSPTSLQRHFKACYGTTVVEFLRARKLDQARDALERNGISITKAAYLAGYSSPANFATAFRRAFGMQPRTVRR